MPSGYITTKEAAINQLAALTDKITIVTWAGAVTKHSTFFTSIYNKEFQYAFHQLLDGLKRGNSPSKFGRGRGGHNKGVRTGTGRAERYGQYKARLKELGLTNVSQLPEIKAKKAQTNLVKCGQTTNLKCPETKQKIKETNLRKYGHECSLHGGSPLLKKLKTWEKYEGGNPATDPAIRAKTIQTRINTGLIKLVNGKRMCVQAAELGVSYSAFQSTVKYEGVESALSLRTNTSRHEIQMQGWFSPTEIITNHQVPNTKFRPDILFPADKLIVEIDGLYWHSEKITKSKQYHADKQRVYAAQGYRSLFFRSDELKNSPDILKSMIQHRRGLTPNKFSGRKCEVLELLLEEKTSFFNTNHLMGTGRGRAFALTVDGKPVAAIQVCWKSKDKKILDVSRFCTALNTSVAGGYGKLLAYVEHEYKPNSIDTFCDLRYGQPEYLTSIGFTHIGTHLSFSWTNYLQTWHRMQYPGNTGIEKGLHRIWDCGQALYRKVVSSPANLVSQ